MSGYPSVRRIIVIAGIGAFLIFAELLAFRSLNQSMDRFAHAMGNVFDSLGTAVKFVSSESKLVPKKAQNFPADARKDTRDACVALLSGFPKDDPAPPKPLYPTDTTGFTLEYFASGCYGNCPAFTLSISKETAVFEGHAYTRAKGKRTAKLSSQQFETFLHAWYDANFYAMRDDYCSAHCPDGTAIVVTDIAGSSITLTTSTFKKRVYECFLTVNNQPRTPKPPEQYFRLSHQLQAFAKAQHWL